MALSPYKNPDSLLNRNRSSSCSSPIRNRIVYHEIYSLGANTLVRSYSCDRVFDTDGSGRSFQTTQIQVSSFITPEKKIHKKSDEEKSKKPRRLPLEFPGSNENTTKSSIKHTPNILLIILKRTMLFTLMTIISACIFLLYFTNRESTYVWDLKKTEYDLKNNIFGQDQAMEKISSVLKICSSTRDMHVMIFTGGVGVGKTYASSIISRNFPWSSNKFITYSEYFSEDAEILLKHKLSPIGYNLVIVDDLSVKAASEALNLVALLNNNRQEDEKILIILIFQTHTEADRNEVTGKFKNTNFNVYHASFQPLTEDIIEKCFNAEIERQKVEISSAEFNKLVKDKMKYVDVIKGPPGCKGVADEVASFYKKN